MDKFSLSILREERFRIFDNIMRWRIFRYKRKREQDEGNHVMKIVICSVHFILYFQSAQI
jgi:hypothetical protein